MERCDTCAFGIERGKLIGCRRRAPTVQAVLVRPAGKTYEEWQSKTMFPQVEPAAWCGEWAPKVDTIEPDPDGIREAAIAYVRARRAKLEARTARNALLLKHSLEHDDHQPCYRAVVYTGGHEEPEYDRIPEDEWCDHCRAANGFHEEYQRQVRVAAGAIRSLEHRVNKAEGQEG